MLAMILVWGHWGRRRSIALSIILDLGTLGGRCSIVLAIILDVASLGEEVFNSLGNNNSNVRMDVFQDKSLQVGAVMFRTLFVQRFESSIRTKNTIQYNSI